MKRGVSRSIKKSQEVSRSIKKYQEVSRSQDYGDDVTEKLIFYFLALSFYNPIIHLILESNLKPRLRIMMIPRHRSSDGKPCCALSSAPDT